MTKKTEGLRVGPITLVTLKRPFEYVNSNVSESATTDAFSGVYGVPAMLYSCKIWSWYK